MAPSPGTPEILPAGTRLARRYVVGERLGGGGMAQGYRGEHETIARPVAIKVLAKALSATPALVVRFLQEARASSKVRHENVVEVTDFGETADGRPFIVMEFLEGEDLDGTLRREGPLPWERARSILVQILAALQAAHEKGVIHRDMKPENVFRISRMGSDDFVKVFDFGIAKVLQDDGGAARPLTLEGQVMGTPAYMAPEQCLGEAIDARTDVYAVGGIAYQMLTGRTPFVADSTGTLLYSQVYESPPPMAKANPEVRVDPAVEARIMKALSKRPDDRYASAKEFADALLQDVDLGAPGLLPSLRALFRRKR